MLEAESTPGP